jgi:hypothetical protein
MSLIPSRENNPIPNQNHIRNITCTMHLCRRSVMICFSITACATYTLGLCFSSMPFFSMICATHHARHKTHAGIHPHLQSEHLLCLFLQNLRKMLLNLQRNDDTTLIHLTCNTCPKAPLPKCLTTSKSAMDTCAGLSLSSTTPSSGTTSTPAAKERLSIVGGFKRARFESVPEMASTLSRTGTLGDLEGGSGATTANV